MKRIFILFLILFTFIQVKSSYASDIVINNADTIIEDTLCHSDNLAFLISNMSPRILLNRSNTIYRSDLLNIPTSFSNILSNLPSTRRLVINYAASSYILPLTYTSIPAGVEETEKNNIPDEFMLFQNYPNPFNSSTTISYQIPKICYVNISIFDINGRLVQTLVNQRQNAAKYKVIWDGKDNSGNDVCSGLYFYVVKTGNFKDSRKMLILR